MSMGNTIRALAGITDEGLFELLASAVLREANPLYGALAHTGVNADGKTIKTPVDGICFVPGADPPRLIAVQHAICSEHGLKMKWLHDPSTVTPRTKRRPTAPAGDLIKTALLVAEERKRTPNLRATLVLTTNKEPSEAVIRAVVAAGRDHGLDVDIWSRSRLGHFLDIQPAGQWIRRSFLSIEQELLSAELLHELSRKSLEIHRPPDDPIAWVPRALDVTLATGLRDDVTFLVSGSGLGKSVACYRKLAAHIEAGGFGIVLPHEVVASALTLEQAIATTLRHLHSSLAATPAALSICSPKQPLLLLVEDINRSGQTHLLLERLASWSRTAAKDNEDARSPWCLLCPVWPESLASLGDQVRERIERLTLPASGFVGHEGREAVLARARLENRDLSPLSAETISSALGDDPLLIALHDQNKSPEPHHVIRQFVEGATSRAATAAGDYPAADYRQAIRGLAGEMLIRRHIALSWGEVSGWAGVRGEPLRLLGRLAHLGELLRFAGPSDNQKLEFRHDRVREWVLVDAAADLDQRALLADDVVADPYFAEVMGALVVWGRPSPTVMERVAARNPLALFHALRLCGQSSTSQHEAVLRRIVAWLDDPVTHEQSNLHVRWEALAMLAETDSPEVPALVRKFRDQTIAGAMARLRNGELSGGISLCANLKPGVRSPQRDRQIEHAKIHLGGSLIRRLCGVLERTDLNEFERSGALRLAGHLGDPGLAVSISACWAADGDRSDHLADYLWAFGRCCGDAPDRYLGPVCDAWAELSDEPDREGLPSPRDRLAQFGLHWAFCESPPISAIEFFVQRGSQDDLRGPITHMIHGVDHPAAVGFVARELAAIQRGLEGTQSFSLFLLTAKDVWRQAQEDHGRPMSRASRAHLLDLWRDEKNDSYLRAQALTLWAATVESDDLEILRGETPSEGLTDGILSSRLIRGDQQAIPMLIAKLAADEHGYWWQHGRWIWSLQLTNALDERLERRGVLANLTWGESFELDWITSEMTMRLPESEAERLLLKHWSHLRFSAAFVQAALYVATRDLVEAARVAIAECPEPEGLLEFAGQHFGIRVKYHPGITREAQVLAVVPYLRFLSPLDVWKLWGVCNEHGWFTMRRELLDCHMRPPFLRCLWSRARVETELDEIATGERFYVVNRWIDDFLKTDVSWSEILATMRAWLDKRRSIGALHVLAAALAHRGTSEDLDLLATYEGMPELVTI